MSFEILYKLNGEAKRLLMEQPVALATINEDLSPNICYVALVKALDDKTLLITDNFLGKTVKNIKRNPNVALAVCNENWKETSNRILHLWKSRVS